MMIAFHAFTPYQAMPRSGSAPMAQRVQAPQRDGATPSTPNATPPNIPAPQMPTLPPTPEALAPWLFFKPNGQPKGQTVQQQPPTSPSIDTTNGASAMPPPQQSIAPQEQAPAAQAAPNPPFNGIDNAQAPFAQDIQDDPIMQQGPASGPATGQPDGSNPAATPPLPNNAPMTDQDSMDQPPPMDDMAPAPADAPLPPEPAPEAPPAPELPPLPVPTTPPPTIRGFDDNVIRTLNIRLEDPDWMRRTNAANDFYIILGANPNLEKRKQYKKYVDAFAIKILRDPSAVVHEPMLRAMQVGYYRYPSKAVLAELQRLRNSAGMLGLEAQIVDDAIYGIQKAQHQDAIMAQQDKQNEQQNQQKQPAQS